MSETSSNGTGAEKKRMLVMVLVFAAGFAAALAIAVLFMRPGATPSRPVKEVVADPGAGVTLGEAELAEFFQAAESSDFEAMDRLGRELFKAGATVADRERLLAEYETTSYPPHTVYAFSTEIRDDAIHRVLLTLDDNDKVVSFLSEKMEIVK